MTTLRERAAVGYARFVSGLLTVLGLLGLLKTNFTGFASSDGETLFWMSVNPLTNVIHLAAGLVGIAMARRVDSARRFALAVGVVGVPFALLEFAVGDSRADIFGRDARMAGVHLAVAAAGLLTWWWTRPAAARPDPAV